LNALPEKYSSLTAPRVGGGYLCGFILGAVTKECNYNKFMTDKSTGVTNSCPSYFQSILVDSGNHYATCISKTMADQMELTYKPGKGASTVNLACKGTTQKVLGVTDQTVIITFLKDKYLIRPTVIPNLAHPINLGAHFLSRFKGIVDYKNNMVTLGQETIPFFS
jgi:hypothetical protein